MGYGFDDTDPINYGKSYWLEYLKRDRSPTGAMLTSDRIRLVNRYIGRRGEIVDVGIGGGRFVRQRGRTTWGFDVCPSAINFLRKTESLWNVYGEARPQNISCWDSLEHIIDPAKLVDRVLEHVFVSMPVYTSLEDCLRSKHYKPGEHIWYFTDWGLRLWFENRGFELLESNDMEVACGREGIETFVFRRLE